MGATMIDDEKNNKVVSKEHNIILSRLFLMPKVQQNSPFYSNYASASEA
jgi:hypothetical protein